MTENKSNTTQEPILTNLQVNEQEINLMEILHKIIGIRKTIYKAAGIGLLLGIIVGFIVLTIIKHKYPAILTKKIYFESLFNYNINFTPEVIYFITNALTNPALYNISNSVIYNIHNGVGIWTNNNIINREFYCYCDLNDDIKKTL